MYLGSSEKEKNAPCTKYWSKSLTGKYVRVILVNLGNCIPFHLMISPFIQDVLNDPKRLFQ